MNASTRVDRRTVLSGVGSLALVGSLAGCSTDGGGDGGDGGDSGDSGGDGGDGGATVVAGPNGDFVFEPESVTISTGETVTWEFASPNHNVVAWPDMHEKVSVPEGAGFGSVEQGGDAFATVEEGETYSHTFEEAGEFTYVCVPHASADMVGTVVVE
jgi:plastocyanin